MESNVTEFHLSRRMCCRILCSLFVHYCHFGCFEWFPGLVFVICRLAFGNEYGVAVIDVVQKVCLLNIGTPDLYGNLISVLF